ncbi:MAG: hypothetical protein ACTSWY_08895 [Promethearchaeota archaeon]
MKDEDEGEIFCHIAKVGENKTGGQIKFPSEIYDIIKSKSKAKNVLSIITSDLRKIVLFPTNSDSGIYAKIYIKRQKTGLGDTFFLDLRKETAKFNLKTLFTTGVCFSEDRCYWEGIFEHYEGFPLEKFKKSLEKIKSVISIKVNILNTPN